MLQCNSTSTDFEAGNPEIAKSCKWDKAPFKSDSLLNEVDVLIIGCGPAGLTLAAQLAAFPDINTPIVEQKSGRLLLGQANGYSAGRWRVPGVRLQRTRDEGSVLDQRDGLRKPDDIAEEKSLAMAEYRMSKTGSRSLRTSF